MKNKYKFFFISIFVFLLSTNIVYSDDFNFQATEIEVLENGNLITAKNGVEVLTNDGILINSKEFKYDKIKNILTAIGDVRFVDDINEVSVKEDLVKYESHSYFPERINVSAVQINDNEVKQITYERGAGETLSCGTAACAVYAICREYRNTKAPLIIHQAGGTLVLSANENADIIMKGDTIFEYQDVISL